MRRKLNIQFIIVGVVTFLVTFVLMLKLFGATVIKGVKSDLERDTQTIAWLFESTDDLNALEVYHGTKIRITLFDENGVVIFESADHLQNEVGCDFGEYPEIKAASRNIMSSAERVSDITGLKTYYCATRLKDNRIIRLATDINPVQMMFEQAGSTLMIVFVLVLFISTVSAFLISKSMMKWLTVKLELLETDPYATLPKELESVANAAKQQYIKRQENEKTRREFTANISHELKTPLTSISGYAEMIETGIARDEDIKPFAKHIHDEAGRMITLIGDIIKLTELDETGVNIGDGNFELLDLCEIAKETVANLEINAKQKNVAIRFEGEYCTMHGDRSQLYEIVYNLCDNAIRYNKKGGFVTVSVMRDENSAILKVVDTGIGIPEEYRTRIFERFFRVDKSHSRNSGGTGLGLAIVKHAALCHGADITVKDGISGGTEIKVEFPLNNAQNNPEKAE